MFFHFFLANVFFHFFVANVERGRSSGAKSRPGKAEAASCRFQNRPTTVVAGRCDGGAAAVASADHEGPTSGLHRVRQSRIDQRVSGEASDLHVSPAAESVAVDFPEPPTVRLHNGHCKSSKKQCFLYSFLYSVFYKNIL